MTNWRARVGARVGAWVGGFGVPGGFDATSGQRRLKGLVTSHAHVKALIAASGPGMNARARWLVRNNGYAANAIESWVANTVGDGISPNSSIAQAARKDAVQRLWLAWTDDADAEGLTDFYGLQRRAAREVFTTGEVFLRFRPRRVEDRPTVPLQIQLLPPETPLLSYNSTDAKAVTQTLRRAITYWIETRHS
jgi:capsid protein